ncbi:hypothetical protein SARC_02143 [Sphaeroforma arctica JP610]|uniref:Uncharacterized protein n=1 Tax=Sphaeroforma arctica JP610 TaxID=667725 RepID=A0A0L0G9W6_9EUKA|nr:hypothetical protein SARC_02143 [Sphaeroforma arctica JP610]KNC85694.1 hypothetical protein SARC_02143 [Sphaeroforma arctica JP610]|eukprot:XP_014159596.1 hypothetical protein SARC_02143 [Sphaeroforma arctica JP610]
MKGSNKLCHPAILAIIILALVFKISTVATAPGNLWDGFGMRTDTYVHANDANINSNTDLDANIQVETDQTRLRVDKPAVTEQPEEKSNSDETEAETGSQEKQDAEPMYIPPAVLEPVKGMREFKKKSLLKSSDDNEIRDEAANHT